jgi:hypothetical protein
LRSIDVYEETWSKAADDIEAYDSAIAEDGARGVQATEDAFYLRLVGCALYTVYS